VLRTQYIVLLKICNLATVFAKTKGNQFCRLRNGFCSQYERSVSLCCSFTIQTLSLSLSLSLSPASSWRAGRATLQLHAKYVSLQVLQNLDCLYCSRITKSYQGGTLICLTKILCLRPLCLTFVVLSIISEGSTVTECSYYMFDVLDGNRWFHYYNRATFNSYKIIFFYMYVNLRACCKLACATCGRKTILTAVLPRNFFLTKTAN